MRINKRGFYIVLDRLKGWVVAGGESLAKRRNF